jgi:chromosome segregation ATPase
MPLEIWTDINGNAARTQFKGGTKYIRADAQATIAALQARVRELEQWVQDQSTANLEKMRHTDEMQSRAMDAESQLTQRTAERDTARRRVDELEARDVDVVLLRDDLEQRTAELEAVSNFIGVKYDAESKTWVSGQAPYLSAGTTKQEACIAAVDALRLACATWETKYRDLQAELERVRGELVEATHNVNVYQSLYSTSCMDRALLENDLRDLRTLIAALPKVEGAVVVSNGYVKDSTRCHALFGADEDAALYAALLQHRQGME